MRSCSGGGGGGGAAFEAVFEAVVEAVAARCSRRWWSGAKHEENLNIGVSEAEQKLEKLLEQKSSQLRDVVDPPPRRGVEVGERRALVERRRLR